MSGRHRSSATHIHGAVLLKAWAHASSKSARFGHQELVGTPLTVPCGPIFSTSDLQQGFAPIALVTLISQEASRGDADCECKRAHFHAAELRFKVRQQPRVSSAAIKLVTTGCGAARWASQTPHALWVKNLPTVSRQGHEHHMPPRVHPCKILETVTQASLPHRTPDEQLRPPRLHPCKILETATQASPPHRIHHEQLRPPRAHPYKNVEQLRERLSSITLPVTL